MSVIPFAFKPKLMRLVRFESGLMSPMLFTDKLNELRLVSVESGLMSLMLLKAKPKELRLVRYSIPDISKIELSIQVREVT